MDNRERLIDLSGNDELLCADGFDECIIGYIMMAGGEQRALYSYQAMISLMIERDGMSEEEAIEYFDYNIMGYGGDGLPAYAFLSNEE